MLVIAELGRLGSKILPQKKSLAFCLLTLRLTKLAWQIWRCIRTCPDTLERHLTAPTVANYQGRTPLHNCNTQLHRVHLLSERLPPESLSQFNIAYPEGTLQVYLIYCVGTEVLRAQVESSPVLNVPLDKEQQQLTRIKNSIKKLQKKN